MSRASSWTEVRVLVPIGWHELVADALASPPCSTVAFGRTSLAAEPPAEGFDYVSTYLPSRADTPLVRDRIRRAVADLAERAQAAELSGLDVRFRPLPAEDWEHSWKKSWKPFRVGRVCVVPPRDERRMRERDVRLVLEPGGAFGSGRHATTRACLRALQELVRAGASVLDAGTGSGILAVAAVLLGARRALGFDTDPNAIPYAVELAGDNAVSDRCAFRAGGFEAVRSDGPFDLVLANLYADAIQAHARDVRERLAPCGTFVFSGCPSHSSDATRRAIHAAGLALADERVRGRWHTFVGARA